MLGVGGGQPSIGGAAPGAPISQSLALQKNRSTTAKSTGTLVGIPSATSCGILGGTPDAKTIGALLEIPSAVSSDGPPRIPSAGPFSGALVGINSTTTTFTRVDSNNISTTAGSSRGSLLLQGSDEPSKVVTREPSGKSRGDSTCGMRGEEEPGDTPVLPSTHSFEDVCPFGPSADTNLQELGPHRKRCSSQPAFVQPPPVKKVCRPVC